MTNVFSSPAIAMWLVESVPSVAIKSQAVSPEVCPLSNAGRPGSRDAAKSHVISDLPMKLSPTFHHATMHLDRRGRSDRGRSTATGPMRSSPPRA